MLQELSGALLVCTMTRYQDLNWGDIWGQSQSTTES